MYMQVSATACSKQNSILVFYPAPTCPVCHACPSHVENTLGS